jgi:Na+-driven multidrug efflux pump
MSNTASNLLFTGSYLIFVLLIERYSNELLSIFQIQLNLLNIMAVINSAIISSGCIIMASVHLNDNASRYLIFKQNAYLNMFIIFCLLCLIYINQEWLIALMGAKIESLLHFKHTFLLLSFIYLIDQIRSLFIQTMIYMNDYIMPPLMRIILFSFVSISIALYLVTIKDYKLVGILLSISIGTLISSFYILMRWKSKNYFSLLK